MAGEIYIYFMRHGRSRADDEGVHEGRYDSPLTDVGRAQVKARGEGWLAQGIRFDLIIASTLVRARESAEIIGGLLKAPVEADDIWMEMDNRPLAGMPIEEAKARYPRPQFRGPYEPFHGVGESDWELHCRAVSAVEKLVRRGAGQYLVVSHGGMLNAVLRGIVGAQPPINGHGIWFEFGDAGYAKCSYDPGGHYWVLRELCPGV
ncbi:MAG: histidine phosphatase family protein [Chloroflexota bacterium]|nr:histidine phosphatase family protein [Chloroflexota bacterium]MBI5704240.1 histidine phosphatase family protein [Chloroflexota bacterium]